MVSEELPPTKIVPHLGLGFGLGLGLVLRSRAIFFWGNCPRTISVHQRCINSLLTEVSKYIHGLPPEIMNQVFPTRAIYIYNNWQFNVFQIHISTSNNYELNWIPHKANQVWNLLPEILKSSLSLTLFKKEKRLLECFNCPWNICNTKKISGFHHMGNAWVLLTITHSMAKCNKTHRMKRA